MFENKCRSVPLPPNSLGKGSFAVMELAKTGQYLELKDRINNLRADLLHPGNQALPGYADRGMLQVSKNSEKVTNEIAV